MFENSAVRRNPKANSRCTSVSTIDSVLAAELAREYDSCQEFPKFQTDASPPRAQNNMTFDKSEGIHVGDVINYYYQSPSIEVSKHLINNTSPSSDSDIMSTSSDPKKPNILLLCIRNRKYILLIALISLIITASAITAAVFMMPNKNGNADMEETTTTDSSTLPSTATIDSSTLSSTTTTTTTTTQPTTTVTTTTTETTTTEPTTTIPTLPPEIELESYKSRSDWNADPPRAIIELSLPIYRIIIAHTGGESCDNENSCKRIVKELQETSTHLDDIPFNFLIGDDSNIYEGRGFERQGQHSSNEDATEYNSIGICVAFIGNYSSVELNETQINVFNEFLEYFLQKGIIVENYVLLSHDQLVYNENPADKLFDEIQNWSGFRKLQKVYHRAEWGAEKPYNISERFNHTVKWALLGSTYTRRCSNFSECAESVRAFQQESFKNLTNISCAFVVGGNGLIFEGRGWDFIGQHSEGYDHRSIGVFIINNQFGEYPSEFVNATRDFLEDGAALGKLTLDYTVNGRQEVERHFFGPGGDFLNYVFNWDHYIRLPRPKSELKQRSAKKMTPK